jgi:YidC/Oxa1 family membrane protein insertase
MNLFEKILYFPILNALIFICRFLTRGDLGFAIILLTLFIRLFFLPLTFKSQKSQKEILDFQKEIQEIREKYKENKEEQAKALISFYQKKKFNPFSSFIWVLIQLPILYALYKVFTQGLGVLEIGPSFLGIFDLSKPNVFFAIFAGFLQYFQTPPSTQKSPDPIIKFSNLIQKQMLFFFSLITFLFLLKFPSALSLYWIANSLFSIVFQKIFFKKYA